MDVSEWKMKFANKGLNDDFNADITYHVMKDLLRRPEIDVVDYNFSEQLGRMYLTTDTPPNIYLPISVKEKLQFSILNNYVSTLTTSSDQKTIVLAFLSRDLQCIYYNLSEGLPS